MVSSLQALTRFRATTTLVSISSNVIFIEGHGPQAGQPQTPLHGQRHLAIAQVRWRQEIPARPSSMSGSCQPSLICEWETPTSVIFGEF